MDALYEISNEIVEKLGTLDLYVDPETGEIADEADFDGLMESINELEMNFTDKAANVAKYIQELKALAKDIADAKKAMSIRQKAAANKADRLTQYLLDEMQKTGIKKVECAELCVSVAKSPVAVEVLDEKQIPAEWWKPQDPVLDKQGLKAALKDGKDVPGVRLGAQGVRLMIR